MIINLLTSAPFWIKSIRCNAYALKIKRHKINMDEVFVVSRIIDEFPYSCSHVKQNYLKHKEKVMNINQLDTHLQIKVISIWAQESEGTKNPNVSFIFMVEKSPTYLGDSGKAIKQIHPKRENLKIPHNPTRMLIICGKLGH